MTKYDKARNALEDFDDYTKMFGVEVIGPYKVLKTFIDEAEKADKVKNETK